MASKGRMCRDCRTLNGWRYTYCQACKVKLDTSFRSRRLRRRMLNPVFAFYYLRTLWRLR